LRRQPARSSASRAHQLRADRLVVRGFHSRPVEWAVWYEVLARPSIFVTEHFKGRDQRQARENLKTEIAQLDGSP
jgi:predicted metal-dependent HD superfamily phosphohydrolase